MLRTIDSLIDITRLRRPVGYMLLFYPFAFSIAMAAYGNPEAVSAATALGTAAGYFSGCVLMRSASCIINDLWDKNVDIRVRRTALRPIPSGRITTPVALGAAAALSVLTLLGGIALIDHSTLILCSAFACASAVYPLSKRFVPMPQLVLGGVYSGGSLIGWHHVCGSLDPLVTVPLYISCVCWTVTYDTIYAMQDREDDRRINVQSSALYFGDRVQTVLAGFLAAMAAAMALSGYANGQGTVFYILSVCAPSAVMALQIASLKGMENSGFHRVFSSNAYIGLLILAGMLADSYLRSARAKKRICKREALES